MSCVFFFMLLSVICNWVILMELRVVFIWFGFWLWYSWCMRFWLCVLVLCWKL